ncbi:MAG: DUF3418 domain-containing protein, partial [Kiritimatiellales bacterium]|nr:DUF3418 domain-containing protein [Kiritimatiellales bacterium]
QPQWNADKGFVYAQESIISGGLTLVEGRNVHFGPINPEEARKIFIREGMVPGKLSTRSGWIKLHRRMLDEITSLEEKIRRPGSLLDTDAIFDHFDHQLPPDVYSVKTLEKWIGKTKARIAMRMEDAMYPQSTPITPKDYPDELTFHEEDFHLIYTFDPGEELDGIALVCPTDKLAFLPDWAPDWLVPGWLAEKVGRLLRTLPKSLRTVIMPIDQTAKDFALTCTRVGRQQPLMDSLSSYLQQEFKLPADASDFDETALPAFLRMKVIETENNEIVHIHSSISDEHRLSVHRSGAEMAFAKWSLPPQKAWPGDVLPTFITGADSKKTRGYPALTADVSGVGRQVFISQTAAEHSHRAGLVKLFRMQFADQVKYVEKRPPLTPAIQLTMSTIDDEFLTGFFDAAIHDALTEDSTVEIRDAITFAQCAEKARTILYETAAEQTEILGILLEQREKIISGLERLAGADDSRYDLEMQLEFLFRPGFFQTLEVFHRYPRYLKAMQVRIQRIRNNPQADLRKLAEIEPFQNRLTAKMLETENLCEAHDLIEFAMLVEEFRVNRFAPEIKTPAKVSAQRLDAAWNELSD